MLDSNMISIIEIIKQNLRESKFENDELSQIREEVQLSKYGQFK